MSLFLEGYYLLREYCTVASQRYPHRGLRRTYCISYTYLFDPIQISLSFFKLLPRIRRDIPQHLDHKGLFWIEILG